MERLLPQNSKAFNRRGRRANAEVAENIFEIVHRGMKSPFSAIPTNSLRSLRSLRLKAFGFYFSPSTMYKSEVMRW